MALAKIKNNAPKPSQININGQRNLTHFSYGILAIDNTAISGAEVGIIELVKPSPNW